jgi:hypothetical protein
MGDRFDEIVAFLRTPQNRTKEQENRWLAVIARWSGEDGTALVLDRVCLALWRAAWEVSPAEQFDLSRDLLLDAILAVERFCGVLGFCESWAAVERERDDDRAGHDQVQYVRTLHAVTQGAAQDALNRAAQVYLELCARKGAA